MIAERVYQQVKQRLTPKVIPVVIGGNFAEWAMHRFVMHRLKDVFAIRPIYEVRTIEQTIHA